MALPFSQVIPYCLK